MMREKDFSAERLRRGCRIAPAKRAFRGTNSFRGNEGVGEHVRTRSHAGLLAR
jgi:hypothetical protein